MCFYIYNSLNLLKSLKNCDIFDTFRYCRVFGHYKAIYLASMYLFAQESRTNLQYLKNNFRFYFVFIVIII